MRRRWLLGIVLLAACTGSNGAGEPTAQPVSTPTVVTPSVTETGPTSTVSPTPAATAEPTPTPTPTPTSTPTPTAAVTPSPVVAADPPASWIGVTSEGAVVEVDTATGEVLATLAQYDDPDDFGDEEAGQEPVAGGNFVDGVALSPDRETLYLALCCEPAPGRLARLPRTGGEPAQLGNGDAPDVSPDGERLASIQIFLLVVTDLASGDVDAVRQAPGGEVVALLSITWDLDGQSVYVLPLDSTEEPPRLLRVRPGVDETYADAEVITLPDGVTPALVRVLADGRVLVVSQLPEVHFDVPGPSRLLAIDVDNGSVEELAVVQQRVLDLSLDASRTLPILVREDGVVLYLGPDGMTELGRGFVAAAW